MRWPKSLSRKIKSKASLNNLTTFKIGGPARFFLHAASLRDLEEALRFAKNNALPVFLLGSGSNILIDDRGLDGLVIKLSGHLFTKARVQGRYLEAGGGLKLNQLILCAKDRGLSGLEFFAGIPGTLGGALAMNAGAWGKAIGDLVEEVKVLDYNGNFKTFKKNQIRFSYRSSSLRRYIIVRAKLRLTADKKERIGQAINRLLKQRGKTQQNNLPNAGCIFKNPQGQAAGRLIEACGLKNTSRGDAVISAVHANFILNRGQAASSDVLSLMRLVRRKVQRKFKVSLEPEIIIWK